MYLSLLSRLKLLRRCSVNKDKVINDLANFLLSFQSLSSKTSLINISLQLTKLYLNVWSNGVDKTFVEEFKKSETLRLNLSDIIGSASLYRLFEYCRSQTDIVIHNSNGDKCLSFDEFWHLNEEFLVENTALILRFIFNDDYRKVTNVTVEDENDFHGQICLLVTRYISKLDEDKIKFFSNESEKIFKELDRS